MNPPARKRGRPRKNPIVTTTDDEANKSQEESTVSQIQNLLTAPTSASPPPRPVLASPPPRPVLAPPQRKAARAKKKYKEESSGEEYQQEASEEEEEYDEADDDDEEEQGPKNRRSSSTTAAKRKSVATPSKEETENWGNYRNTIDNGPVPAHALTLNEIAFDVALKLQTEHEEQRLTIDYLDDNNPIEFVHDKQFKEHVLQDTYSVHLASTNDENPAILTPFASTVHKENVFTVNVGLGPVQSLDWLSMPTSYCPVTQQYLAVGCSRSSVVSKHFYDESYSYKNYIQLWMFDLSSNKTTVAPKEHRLIGLIPLDDSGAIWSLKWSPTNLYPAAYLAAATASGAIYLFKIFSDVSKFVSTSCSSSNEQFPCYHSNKSIQFVLPEPNHRTQCLAIDWSKHDPTRLAAAYSNGIIAQFHVNSTAKYLTEIKNEYEKMIYPIRLIRSSPTPIRDIKFLNDASNLVVTVANVAKRFTVWDFDDSRQPLIDIENSGTESVVRSLTGDLLCAKEFTPSYARTSAYLNYDPENNNIPKHIYFQSTPDHVLSIDYSPWLDSALLCDSNGHVYFFRLTNFVRWTRKNECSLKYRLKIFNLSANVKSDQQINTRDPKIEPSFEQSSYLELIDQYYLDTQICCDQKFVSKQDDFSKAGSYALNALHKIRFNPNLGSYAWYAFAGESGLLFVLPLKQSWSNHAKTVYEQENKSK